MSTTQDSNVRLPADLAEVVAEQERIFAERQPESRRMATAAAASLAGGVTSKLADHRTAAGLAQPRPRLQDL